MLTHAGRMRWQGISLERCPWCVSHLRTFFKTSGKSLAMLVASFMYLVSAVHRDTSTSVYYLAGLLVMVGIGFQLCLDFQAVWSWSDFTCTSILFLPWKEIFLPNSDHRPSPAQLLIFHWESSDFSTSRGFLSLSAKLQLKTKLWQMLVSDYSWSF